jgi:hypothetical protein
MNIAPVSTFLDILTAICAKTSDPSERLGVASAIAKVNKCPPEEMPAAWKAIHAALFHHKGPLHDSLDRSAEVEALRERAFAASEQAMKFLESKLR